MTGYMDFLYRVASGDIEILRDKDAEYGGSWKKRGGVGAYMMAARKFDRIEEQLKKAPAYDIFAHAIADQRPEGILDDIADLRRYLLLIEAEIRALKALAAGFGTEHFEPLVPGRYPSPPQYSDTTGQERPFGFSAAEEAP